MSVIWPNQFCCLIYTSILHGRRSKFPLHWFSGRLQYESTFVCKVKILDLYVRATLVTLDISMHFCVAMGCSVLVYLFIFAKLQRHHIFEKQKFQGSSFDFYNCFHTHLQRHTKLSNIKLHSAVRLLIKQVKHTCPLSRFRQNINSR